MTKIRSTKWHIMYFNLGRMNGKCYYIHFSENVSVLSEIMNVRQPTSRVFWNLNRYWKNRNKETTLHLFLGHAGVVHLERCYVLSRGFTKPGLNRSRPAQILNSLPRASGAAGDSVPRWPGFPPNAQLCRALTPRGTGDMAGMPDCD